MKYYKYPWVDDENSVDYIEVDDKIVMRQLTVFEHKVQSSNVDLLLADQPFEYEELQDIEEIKQITAEEFNAVWQKHLQAHETTWNAAKNLFPINKRVVGCMKIFFPQGIIVQLGQGIFGVTDYWQARATASSKFIMGTRYQISGIVTGYDETNQWIKLNSPQIYEDKDCEL